jgi:hypothetical protein
MCCKSTAGETRVGGDADLMYNAVSITVLYTNIVGAIYMHFIAPRVY